jgi:hypothetical protein
VCVAEVGCAEVCPGQVGVEEACPGEVGCFDGVSLKEFGEACPGEVGSDEDGPDPVRLAPRDCPGHLTHQQVADLASECGE